MCVLTTQAQPGFGMFNSVVNKPVWRSPLPEDAVICFRFSILVDWIAIKWLNCVRLASGLAHFRRFDHPRLFEFFKLGVHDVRVHARTRRSVSERQVESFSIQSLLSLYRCA